MNFAEWYKIAKEYKNEYGNLLVPQKYKTANNQNLGFWISTQRRYYLNNKLSDEQIEMLESIGMIWSIHDKQWDDMYELASQYYKKHGDLNIRNYYKTSKKENLGTWICAQRYFYKLNKLSFERIQKLESIGMIWQIHQSSDWNTMYKLAQNYYHKHSNLLVPKNYVAEDGQNLGLWIASKRCAYTNGELSLEKIKKLEAIGMNWKLKERDWNKKYTLARTYYNEHGNLLIPRHGPTKALGDWLKNQRYAHKRGELSSEKIELLANIGMIWDIKANKNDINNYLENILLTIDKELNHTVLKHISLIELQTKINFLNDIDIPPVDKDGKLIDIFSMTSKDIEEKYGVSLVSLIEYYKKSNQRSFKL